MKKEILLLFLTLFLLESCNDKMQNSIQEIINNNSFTSTISDTDKIVFRLKKPNQPELTRNASGFEDNATFKAEKKDQIESFEKLLKDSDYTGYCSCSETNYAIDFYKGSKQLDTYFADTIVFKNKVRIFEKSFQYSYLIEKKKWTAYLKEIKIE